MHFKENRFIVLLFCLAFMPLKAECGIASLVEIVQNDAKAQALAQKVLANMGGRKGWSSTRYLAWTFNDQYQIWDKEKNRFRWQMNDIVAIINTQTREGNVYVEGRELQDPEEKQKILDHTYARFINNSYWLVMPFKLQDPGVILKYVGEEATMDGATADVLEVTFEEVGLTPQNKYKVWVDQEKGLVTQWAFFRKSSDKAPAFIRRWSDYKSYGKIKLASDRSNPQSDFEIFHIASPKSVAGKIFNSPMPVEKLSLEFRR